MIPGSGVASASRAVSLRFGRRAFRCPLRRMACGSAISYRNVQLLRVRPMVGTLLYRVLRHNVTGTSIRAYPYCLHSRVTSQRPDFFRSIYLYGYIDLLFCLYPQLAPRGLPTLLGIRSRHLSSPVFFLVTIEETIRPFEMSLLLRQYYRNTGSPCAAPFLPVVQGPRTASLLRTRSCSPVPRPEWGQLSRPRRRVVISLVFPVRCRPRLDVCRAALPGLRSGSGPLAKTRRVGYSLLCFPFLHFFRDGTCRA